MNKRFLMVGTLMTTVLVWLMAVTAVLSANRPQAGNDLIYSTFLGESAPEEGRNITYDADGNVYIVGFTESTTFPTGTIPFNGEHGGQVDNQHGGQVDNQHGGQVDNQHGIDVYVAKFNADASNLEYVFWFNAITLFAEDFAYGIAVDSNGSAYVTGDTRSSDMCNVFGTVPGYDQTYNNNGDAFVLKINPDGTALDYCTFLGGDDLDIGRAITIDEQGNAYITGGTWSANFPTTNEAFDTMHGGTRDAFVAKLSPDGTSLSYATFLGADDQEETWDIDLDNDHNIYVTGWTRSTNFYTTTGAFDTTHDGGIFDGFLLKLNAVGDALEYATFLGGAAEDKPTSLHIDGTGHAYVGGYTNSANFYTTTNAFDTTYNGGYDGFILKMNPQGSDLLYSTYLGGNSEDWGWGLAVDGSGVAYLVGETWSSNFPTTTLSLDGSLSGGQDAFVTQISTDGSELLTSSYLGGSDWDHGFGIAADGLGHVYVTGETRSDDFPISPSAYDSSHNGNYDIFATKLGVMETAVALQSLTLAGPTNGILNRSYAFTATIQPQTASQPVTYIWQADGQPTITHTTELSDVIDLSWATADTYTITVIAQNLLNTLTVTHIITISSNVEANFAANPLSGQSPLTVTFTNLSGGDFDSSLWDFGDGLTSTITNPVHIYTDVGIYTATLTISGPGGTDSQTRNAYITVRPYMAYLPLIIRNP